MHTQLTVSRSSTRLKLKYSVTATPTAKTEHTNCRTDRPKKSVSRYARISLLILISIEFLRVVLLCTMWYDKEKMKGNFFPMAYSEQLWQDAKKKCRLTDDDIARAKRLGLNPRSLIKNIPSKSEPWKAPVSVWLCEMEEKRDRKAARRKARKAQS